MGADCQSGHDARRARPDVAKGTWRQEAAIRTASRFSRLR